MERRGFSLPSVGVSSPTPSAGGGEESRGGGGEKEGRTGRRGEMKGYAINILAPNAFHTKSFGTLGEK